MLLCATTELFTINKIFFYSFKSFRILFHVSNIFYNFSIQSISYQIHSAQSPCVSMYLFAFQDGEWLVVENAGAALGFPSQFNISKAKWGGKLGASLLRICSNTCGKWRKKSLCNDDVSRYMYARSRFGTALPLREGFLIFRSGFHFLIEVFLSSIPESSSILRSGGIKNCRKVWKWKIIASQSSSIPDRYLWLSASSCFQVYDFHWKMMMHWHERKNEMS